MNTKAPFVFYKHTLDSGTLDNLNGIGMKLFMKLLCSLYPLFLLLAIGKVGYILNIPLRVDCSKIKKKLNYLDDLHPVYFTAGVYFTLCFSDMNTAWPLTNIVVNEIGTWCIMVMAFLKIACSIYQLV